MYHSWLIFQLEPYDYLSIKPLSNPFHLHHPSSFRHLKWSQEVDSCNCCWYLGQGQLCGGFCPCRVRTPPYKPPLPHHDGVVELLTFYVSNRRKFHTTKPNHVIEATVHPPPFIESSASLRERIRFPSVPRLDYERL